MTITIETIMTSMQRDGDGIDTQALAERLGVQRDAVRKTVSNAKTRSLLRAERAESGGVVYWLTQAGRAWQPTTPSERARNGGHAAAGRRAADPAPPPAGENDTHQLGDINVADLAQTRAAPAVAAICADCAGVLGLLADIRAAAGDPHGKLMQDELVERIAGQYRDAGRMHDAVADLAAANAKLEGVAHALRGSGLPALREVTGIEDLQPHVAALTGAYQMLLGRLNGVAQALRDSGLPALSIVDGEWADMVQGGEIEPSEMDLEELAERAADELRNARAMVAKLEHLLQSARNEAEHLRSQIQHAGGDHEGAPIGRPLHALVEDLRGYLEDDQEITVTAGGRLIAVRSAGIGQVFEAPARELPDLLDALATAGKYCNVPF